MGVAVPKGQQFAGQGAVLAAAVLWSTSGLFIRLVDWHPVVIAGTRGFVAALFLLAVRFLFPVSKNAAGKNFTFPFWASAFAHAFMVITFVTANTLTDAANAVLLQYSSPIWTALLAWWVIKEKPRWEHWGALVLVIGGLIIFFRDGLGSGALAGDALGAISGVFIAIHVVFLRMSKDGNPRDVLLASHIIAAVISIPFIFLHPPELTASSVMPILFMGLIQQGAASLLFAYGIKHLSAIQAMLTSTIEPLCNPVWVLLVLGEKPSVSAIIGGSLILAAVLASSIIGNQRKQRKQREREINRRRLE